MHHNNAHLHTSMGRNNNLQTKNIFQYINSSNSEPAQNLLICTLCSNCKCGDAEGEQLQCLTKSKVWTNSEYKWNAKRNKKHSFILFIEECDTCAFHSVQTCADCKLWSNSDNLFVLYAIGERASKQGWPILSLSVHYRNFEFTITFVIKILKKNDSDTSW